MDDITPPDDLNKRNEELQKLIKTISNYKSRITDFDELEDLEAKLGVPTTIEKYTKDNYDYVKKTWDTESGEVTLVFIYAPEGEVPNEIDKKLKTFGYLVKELELEVLERLLEDALTEEDYESAIILRNEINTRNGIEFKP